MASKIEEIILAKIAADLKAPLETPEALEARYPLRPKPAGDMVTRIAPSPTGFMHIGGIYAALISERLAHQNAGTFYLRIEDTDRKREVAGASDLIVKSLHTYGIVADEGETLSGEETGAYGPYKQSARAAIYISYVKWLFENGHAYPCFCTSEEMERANTIQIAEKTRPGYYGRWAVCRNKSEDEVLAALNAGTPFVLRFKSPGNFENRIKVNDLLKGMRELSENDQDIVLLKSDGLPTYHLAHVVDDHLMRTTHVIRGDEWLSSTPLHIQLFQTFGWQAPLYGHILPIQKMDGTSKRKLSKRKDPEASVFFYDEQGYPTNAVIEYLLNLANSNFEDWRKANPAADNREFKVTLEKLAKSNGALFDFRKLNDISKETVARMGAEEVYEAGLAWAAQYDKALAALMETNPKYTKQILNIERGLDAGKSRKDIAKWSDIKAEIGYFFDDEFTASGAATTAISEAAPLADAKAIVSSFLGVYSDTDNKEQWLEKIRAISLSHGYAENTKAFKAEPSKYKGYIGDVTKIFRILLTGKAQTPDLYAIMQVMGKERVMKRLGAI
jgi:glutamyl-tRNA synthetase